MAEALKNMPKSPAGPGRRDPTRGLPCVHLYTEGGVFRRAEAGRPHRHGFWHLDAAVAGRAAVQAEGLRRELRRGQCVFLPPGLVHAFSHDAGSRSVSVKFEAEPAGLAWRVMDPCASERTRPLFEALVAVLSRPPETVPGSGAVIDAVVSALFSECYFPGSGEDHGRPLAARVRAFARARGGRPVTAREAAGRLGLSASQAALRFRREAGTSLKRFLDAERGRQARQLVVYSDLAFKQIADRLGFPDAFGFSRFFRRVHGQSPREARAAAGR